MGRYIVKALHGDVEVIGLAFGIDGTSEEFIVHRSLHDSMSDYAATHLGTGFKIGEGDTIDFAIENGTERWRSRSPDQLKSALDRAKIALAARDAKLAAEREV